MLKIYVLWYWLKKSYIINQVFNRTFLFPFICSNFTLKECQAELCDPASAADCHVSCKSRNGRFKCFCDEEFAFQDMNTGKWIFPGTFLIKFLGFCVPHDAGCKDDSECPDGQTCTDYPDIGVSRCECSEGFLNQNELVSSNGYKIDLIEKPFELFLTASYLSVDIFIFI